MRSDGQQVILFGLQGPAKGQWKPECDTNVVNVRRYVRKRDPRKTLASPLVIASNVSKSVTSMVPVSAMMSQTSMNLW